MLEFEALESLFGVKRYPDLEDAVESLDSSYFLTTGAMIADVLWLMSPASFSKTVRRGKVADLEAALKDAAFDLN
jgi:hypothetical protein